MSVVNTRPSVGHTHPRPVIQQTISGIPNGGTDGQVLTKQSATDGDADWEDATGGSSGSSGVGSLVLLKEVVASGATSADFTSVIGANYDDYELVWENVLPGTNNQNVGIQLSSDNGANWLATDYEYGVKLLGVSTSFEAYARAGSLTLALIGINGFSSSVASSGVTQLFGANTSSVKHIISEAECGNGGDGHTYGTVTRARRTTATTFNAIRILAASGTISGTFRLYGRIKESSPSAMNTNAFDFFDPDKPPTTASAYDDEGDGAATVVPAGFTAFNSPGGTTTFEYDGKGNIRLFIPSGSGDVLRFWHKTVTGDYTVTVKLTSQFAGAYNSGGVCLRDPVTGKMLVLGLQQRAAWPNPPTLIWTWWTNSTTWAGETLGPTIDQDGAIYVQLTWTASGTLITARISEDGIVPFKTWITSNTWFTGGAPTQVGLQVNTQSGGDANAYFGFYRVKAASSDTIGGIRSIGTMTAIKADRFPTNDLPTGLSALDDPFTAITLDSKWSQVGTPAQTIALKRGWLHHIVAAGGAVSANFSGIEQVLPSGNFSVLVPLRYHMMASIYHIAGLHIRNATTGAMLRFVLWNNGVGYGNGWIGLHRYSAFNNRTATPNQNSFSEIRDVVLRIEFDGSTFTFSWSLDGVDFSTYTTEAVGTTFGGGVPNRVGLGIDTFSVATPGKASYGGFKYKNAIGALMNAFAA